MKTASLVAALVLAMTLHAAAAELGGVRVALDAYEGPAMLAAENVGRFRLRLSLHLKGETRPLTIRVELPKTGRDTWPAPDVEVRDAAGRALLVERAGIEWEKLLIPLPTGVTTCLVQAVEPPGGWPRTTAPGDRTILDQASGGRVRIAPWPQGRAAALSIRFDDSHPTHLTTVVPILREYGFRGTFMVNPGPAEPGSRRVSGFERHRAEWEALAKQGDHELANHSARHRGASGDDDMEAEIGGAAQAIWKLSPGRSPLLALNLGGGTRWKTTRTLRHYLEKYHQFDASGGSLGMDDAYGGRVAAFRQMLEQHLQRGLWCRIHYHYIGDGLSSSEANFRGALDLARQRQDRLWIAGMADIHKYQTERDAAKLILVTSDARRLTFRLACATDPALYDQPLTLELILPAIWASRDVTIKDAQGAPVPTTRFETGESGALRFQVLPREALYSIAAES